MAFSLNDAAALRTGTTNTKADEPETVKTEVIGDDRYTHPKYGASPINIKMIRRTLADGTVRFDLTGMLPIQFANRLLEAFGPAARFINKEEFADILVTADVSEFENVMQDTNLTN